MTERQYVYKITQVVKVVDGDSFWLRVDVGFRGELLINVRLVGYDCPESHKGSEFERSKAKQARDLATSFLLRVPIGVDVWIRTQKDPDDFGRWLGVIWREYADGSDSLFLGEVLRRDNLASIWPTRWREEFGEGKT